MLLHIGIAITNQGNRYYKIGQLLQIGAKYITNWAMYYKSGQLLQIGHNNKCHVLLTRDTDVTAKIGEFDVKNSGQEKLLGVKIDTKLFFQKLCFFPLQKSKPDVRCTR